MYGVPRRRCLRIVITINIPVKDISIRKLFILNGDKVLVEDIKSGKTKISVKANFIY